MMKNKVSSGCLTERLFRMTTKTGVSFLTHGRVHMTICFLIILILLIVDLIFAASGFVMGGTVGIETLICAFVVGPVAGSFMPYNQSWIQRTVKKIVK